MAKAKRVGRNGGGQRRALDDAPDAGSALDAGGAPSAESITDTDEPEQPEQPEGETFESVAAGMVQDHERAKALGLIASTPVEPEPTPPWAWVRRSFPVLYRESPEVEHLALVLQVYPDGVVDLVAFHAPRHSAHGGAPQCATFHGRRYHGTEVGQWRSLE